MIDLSIVVPTRNTGDDPEQTKKIDYARNHCLDSLIETTPDTIPIVVASNGGDSAHIIQCNGGHKPRIKRINLYEQGQCKAVNAAVATTNTEWIMVTNDDMIYPHNWFENIKDINEKSPLFYSAKLVEPNPGAPTFIHYFCGGAGGDFDKSKFAEFARLNEVTEVVRYGFNLPFLMKRELWDLVGGYDINYDPWSSNSDSDLEYKIKLAGYEMYQLQNWLVYHFSQTSGTFHPSHRAEWDRNFAYFEEKWGFPRTDDGIWEATFEIPHDKLKYRPKWAVIPGRKEL